MSPLDLPTFYLVDEPWLRVRRLGGHLDDLGILPALTSAHLLAGLSGDVPTQTFALVRMMLAVLHGALAGPTDDQEWEGLWNAEALPVEPIAAYLDRFRNRFDLFHPDTPFLQVAGLHTASGATTGTTTLIADIPNGHKFFTTRLGPDRSLSYAEAARWLVHCHAFDISGIKTGAVGDDRVKGGRGYPIGVGWSGLLGGVLLEGATLKETLLLNLMRCGFLGYEPGCVLDRPAWEREPVTAAAGDNRTPEGPVDLYTWQSRRVRLIPSDGRVRDALVCNGDPLTPQNMHPFEPHTVWRRSKPQETKHKLPLVYMPLEHNPDRAIWRGLQSLLPGSAPRQGAEGADRVSPGILEWLGHLGVEEMISDDHTVRVRTIGMTYGSNNSVTDDVVDDALALRVFLARQDAHAFAGIATSCVLVAEEAARAVGNLAGDLAAAAGGDGTAPRSRAMEALYADLDAPYRQWLSELAPGSDTIGVQVAWHRTAHRLARKAGDELLSNVSPACWEGREVRGHPLTAAHAADRFSLALRKALPFTRTQQSGAATA